MENLTTEDIAWIFQVAVLNNEGKPLTELMQFIKINHITIGRKVLDTIKKEWEKQQ